MSDMIIVKCVTQGCELEGHELEAPRHAHIAPGLVIRADYVCSSCDVELWRMPARDTLLAMTKEEASVLLELLTGKLDTETSSGAEKVALLHGVIRDRLTSALAQ